MRALPDVTSTFHEPPNFIKVWDGVHWCGLGGLFLDPVSIQCTGHPTLAAIDPGKVPEVSLHFGFLTIRSTHFHLLFLDYPTDILLWVSL